MQVLLPRYEAGQPWKKDLFSARMDGVWGVPHRSSALVREGGTRRNNSFTPLPPVAA